MARKSISKTSAYFHKMEFGGRAKRNKSKTGSEFVPNITDNRSSFIDLGNNMAYLVGPKHKNGGINIGSDLNAEGGTRKEEIKARLGFKLNNTEKKKFGEVVENDKLDGSTKIYSAQPIMPNNMSPAEFVVRGGDKDYAFNYQENWKRVLGINDDGTRAEFGTQRKAPRREYTAAQRKRIIEEANIPRTHKNAVELQKRSNAVTTALMSIMAAPLIANASVAGSTASMISKGTNVGTKVRPVVNSTKEVIKGASQNAKDAVTRGVKLASKEIIRDSKDLYQGRLKAIKTIWKGVKGAHKFVNAAPKEIIKSPYTVPRYLYKNINKEELSKIAGIIGDAFKQGSKGIIGKGAQGIKAVAKNAWNNPVDYVLAGIGVKKLFGNTNDEDSTETNISNNVTQKSIVKSKQNKNNIVKEEPKEETQLTITPADTIISKVQKPVINNSVSVSKTSKNVTKNSNIETPRNTNKSEKEKIFQNTALVLKYGGRTKAKYGIYEDKTPWDLQSSVLSYNPQYLATPERDENGNPKKNENGNVIFKRRAIPNIILKHKQLGITNPNDKLNLPTSIDLSNEKGLIFNIPNYTAPQIRKAVRQERREDRKFNRQYNDRLITKGDWAEAGINTVLNIGELASNLAFNAQQRGNIKDNYVATPLVKLNTDYNINPQLNELRQQQMRSQNAINRNTASGNVGLNRYNTIQNTFINNIMKLNAERNNEIIKQINQEVLTNAGITQGNTRERNEFLNRLRNDINLNYDNRRQFISDAFNSHSDISKNLIARSDNRIKQISDFYNALGQYDAPTRKVILDNLPYNVKRKFNLHNIKIDI